MGDFFFSSYYTVRIYQLRAFSHCLNSLPSVLKQSNLCSLETVNNNYEEIFGSLLWNLVDRVLWIQGVAGKSYSGVCSKNVALQINSEGTIQSRLLKCCC